MIKKQTYITASLAALFAIFFVGAMTEPSFAQKENKVTKSDKAKAIAPFKNSKPYTKATKGAWKVECYKTTFEASAGKPEKVFENCVILQDLKSKKSKKVVIRATILQTPSKNKEGKVVIREGINISAPEGIYLPAGVAVEVDGKAEGRFPYLQCRRGICVTQIELDAKRKKKILSAKKMKLLIYPAPGKGTPFTLSLSGLKDAMSIRDKTQLANRKAAQK